MSGAQPCIAIVMIGLFFASLAAAADGNPAPPPDPNAGRGSFLYEGPDQPLDKRLDDLIGRLTLAEKVSLLQNDAPAIQRLRIPKYDFWNECLHGVARAGTATVFPQAIGLAATWDQPLLHEVADTIATEGRAKYNDAIARDRHNRYFGLTFWTPNINIFRDPRWGRGQETYGEDPFLTGRLAVAFITGLQGDDPKYLKAMACAKHFAVHSGPESQRHGFDAKPPARDLHETYLPQFEAAVREGHVGQIMSAYNAVDGVPAPANAWLLDSLLRKEWGFDGVVVSDCDAVADVVNGHHFAGSMEDAVADCVKAGTDLNCGKAYAALEKAAAQARVSEADVDRALRRVLRARFRLGMFDPPNYAFARIPMSENDSPEHAKLALRTARESIVLLKNDGNLLPLDKSKVRRIAVIGANGDDIDMQLGNYNGTPSHPVSILRGIIDEMGSPQAALYAPGCPLALSKDERSGPDSPEFRKAIEAAGQADVVIYVGGLSPRLEGEEMRVEYDGFKGGDRTRIELPEVQRKLLEALVAVGKPVVFVNCSGSAVAMPWVAEHVPAIVQAWYPGQSGGTAVADVLFGRYSPAGRLPVTFYSSTDDLPSFDDYRMANRTYRYFNGKPLFPFGHGLSYTRFEYEKVELSSTKLSAAGGPLHLHVIIRNVGPVDGEEVVQVYAAHPFSAVPQPIHSLCGLARVSISKGEAKTVEIDVPIARLRHWDEKSNAYVIEPGPRQLQVGASSADIRLKAEIAVVP